MRAMLAEANRFPIHFCMKWPLAGRSAHGAISEWPLGRNLIYKVYRLANVNASVDRIDNDLAGASRGTALLRFHL